MTGDGEFPSLIGSLRTQFIFDVHVLRHGSFPSLIGSLRTRQREPGTEPHVEFPSLIGSLRTLRLTTLVRLVEQVSIPHR